MVREQCALQEILEQLPQQAPFRFIDAITYADDDTIEGHYYLDHRHGFYQGHFPGYPITPGVILIEIMAQIGLVAFGLYLLAKPDADAQLKTRIPALAAAQVNFRKQVFPGQTLHVVSRKEVFRHGKLVCDVQLLDEQKCLIAQGRITGFLSKRVETFG